MERFDDIVDASAKARRKKDEREMRINNINPLAPRTVIARDKSGGSRRPSLTDCVCVEAEQERLHAVWRQSVACVKAVGDEDDEPYGARAPRDSSALRGGAHVLRAVLA